MGVSSVHNYFGSQSLVQYFRRPEGSLQVHITTPGLEIRSIKEEDLPDYTTLLGDAEVMAKNGDGSTFNPSETKAAV